MKKTLLHVFLYLLFLLPVEILAAPTTPNTSNTNAVYWYHISFQRGTNLVLQDNGEDAILTSATRIFGNANQLWKIETASTSGFYTFTSKNGRKIYWESSRFKSGSDNTATEIKLTATANGTYPDSWELQRNGSTQAMNPLGGSANGNQIGEYNLGDGGNPIKLWLMPFEESNETLSIWYQVKDNRSPVVYWQNGTVSSTNNALGRSTTSSNSNDNQLFKFVKAPSPSNGYYIYNKSNPDKALYASSTAASTILEFTSEQTPTKFILNYSPVQDKYLIMAESDNKQLNSYSDKISFWNDINDTGNQWSTINVNQIRKSELLTSINTANTLYNTTKQGEEPGQFTTTDRTAFQNAITTAQAAYENPNTSLDNFISSKSSLDAAINTYNNAVILPQLSTEGNERWYFIQGTRPTNTYMTTLGAGGKIRDAAVIPDETQLWKLIENTTTANASTGFSLVNKATGERINTDVGSGTEFSTSTNTPNNKLRFIKSTTLTNQTYRFWIENAVNSTPALRFHAGGSGNSWNAMNYTGDANDNCTWLFLSYTTALKAFLQTGITDAQYLYNNSLEGQYFGQYSSSVRATLNTAISAATTVYANETATENEIQTAIININSAINTFKSSLNSQSTLYSTDPANYRWYRIKNKYYPARVITTNGVSENGNLKCQTSGTTTDSELWRFEANQAGTAFKIINKAQPTLGIQENGQSQPSKLVSFTSTSSEFILEQMNLEWAIKKLGGGTHNYLHCDGSYNLVGWEKAANATQWTFEYVSETTKPTRTVSLTTSNPAYGNVKVTGSELTETTNNNSTISVTATPTVGYYLKNWTNTSSGAIVSTTNPYLYAGSENIGLTANFSPVGTLAVPTVSTIENPVYYYIFSASNGTVSTGGFSGDFTSNVLISPTTSGNQLIRNTLNNATSNDHALWCLINDEGTIKLRNKATGFYLNGRTATNVNVNPFVYSVISDNQYSLKNSNTNFLIAWNTNLCDLWSSAQGANSLTAWYFVSPTFSGDGDISSTANWTNATQNGGLNGLVIDGNAIVNNDINITGLTIKSGKSLTVSPGKKLTLNGPVENLGTLILQSDATSGTATVTGNVSGNATVEQYLPAGADRTWWYLASPVTGAARTVFGSNQVGEYSETSRSYSAPFAATETLTAGKGYVVKMNATQAANVYQFANKALNNGNISVPLTRTVSETLNNKRGFNLVGNPYPSYLNWELAHKASTNVRSTIWYRTKGASAMEFHTYNAALGVSVPTAASGYIPPMQAFWVKVDTDPVSPATVSTGTLNFTNAMRGHAIQGTTTPLKAPATNSLPLLRLALRNGSTSDETVIALHANASTNFDQYDSEKMSNTGTSEVFTLAGTQELTINAQPDSEGSKLIPLGIRPASAGSLSLSVSELKNLDNMQIILHDNVLKTETQLSLNESYNFTTDGTATNNRFSIEFRAPGMTTGLENSNFANFNITVYSGKIQIQSPAMANGQLIRVYSSNGQKIIEQTAKGNNTIIDHKLSSGVYFVKVSNYVQKIIIH